jgi:hypothetical protein
VNAHPLCGHRRVRTVGPDDLIRDVCGAVQDTECVIIAE